MAYGQITNITASPQPGTSNLPYGIYVGGTWLPPFVPVDITITDTYGPAVIAQTAALIKALTLLQTAISSPTGLPALPGSLVACLSGINSSLTRIADSKAVLAKSLSDLNISIGTLTVANNQARVILNQQTANAIQNSNFYMANSPDKPTMPPVQDQLKKAIVDSSTLQSVATASNMFNSFVSSSVSKTQTWITGTDTYQTAVTWVKSAVATITGSFTASAQSILTKIKGG